MFGFYVIKCFNSLLIYCEIFGLRSTSSFSLQLNTYLQTFYFRKLFSVHLEFILVYECFVEI